MKPSSLFSSDVDSTTLDAAWRGIGTRRVRARRLRRALLAAPLVAGLALVLFLVVRRTTPVQPAVAVHGRSDGTPYVIALAGGGPLPAVWSDPSSSVVALDDGSRLELAPNARLHPVGEMRDPARVDLALDRGTTTFDIKPGGPRMWTIEAGETRVRVLGTRFTVARDGEHVRVTVWRGKVRVESSRIAGGGRDLVAGQDIDVGGGGGSNDRIPPTGTPEREPVPAEKLTEARPATATPTRHVKRADAFTSPSSVPETPATPADRMARADAARKAGEPREALAILGSVVDRNEPDAALAAFTMGKIHSQELGDQAAGASWFERAIRLGLPVGLDEDAHSRVVECYGRAGRIDDAAGAASRYEAKFPSGRHLAHVRRWKKE